MGTFDGHDAFERKHWAVTRKPGRCQVPYISLQLRIILSSRFARHLSRANVTWVVYIQVFPNRTL